MAERASLVHHIEELKADAVRVGRPRVMAQFVLVMITVGWIISTLGACMPLLKYFNYAGISVFEQAALVTSAFLAAAPGIYLSQNLDEKGISSRKLVSLAMVVAALALLLAAVQPTFWALEGAVVVGGAACGAAVSAAGKYIRQIMPSTLRGRFYVIGDLGLLSGILLGLSITATWAWLNEIETVDMPSFLSGPSPLFFFPVLPALVGAGASFVGPESPVLLIRQHKGEQALAALVKIRSGSAARIAREFGRMEILASVTDETVGRRKAQYSSPRQKTMTRSAIVAAFGLHSTGVGIIFLFGIAICSWTGTSMTISVIVGMGAVACALFGLIFRVYGFLPESLALGTSRRQSLLVGGVTSIVALLALGLTFAVVVPHFWGAWTLVAAIFFAHTLIVIMVMFPASNSLTRAHTPGPVRARANATSLVVLGLSLGLFLLVADHFGAGVAFFAMAAVDALATVGVARVVPPPPQVLGRRGR
ncbi:MAG: MFS transporter [Winkia neuii]|uniref:MFS transporter n=1 Tax=Winkia neuii TaxID=33007 RepID=UPI0029002AEB|nr:MFS transporter [Winkia neuii]MDU3134764.1 MFS transporter [Winkia neuii]